MNLYFPAQLPANDAAHQSGNWLLQTGRAISLMPAAGGQLTVARGQLWATLGEGGTTLRRNARLARCATLQDHFLNAGDKLLVPPGARLVIESMGRAQAMPAAFAWSLLPQLAVQTTRPRRAGVVQAAGEVVQALGQVAHALRRLMDAVLAGPGCGQPAETCV